MLGATLFYRTLYILARLYVNPIPSFLRQRMSSVNKNCPNSQFLIAKSYILLILLWSLWLMFCVHSIISQVRLSFSLSFDGV